jgi:hypothetical protein
MSETTKQTDRTTAIFFTDIDDALPPATSRKSTMTLHEQGMVQLSTFTPLESPGPSASIQVWSLQAIGFTFACLGSSSVDCRVITPFAGFLLLYMAWQL